MESPPSSASHLGDDDLVALAEGTLAPAARDALIVHADGCAPCRQLLAGVGRALLTPATAALGSDGGEDGDEPPPLARGTAVGRYVIVDRLGAGGMGEVHAAYDPELDRRVALKLLHPGHPDEQQRLLREAKAMARLSHPNVVPVHDVGVWGERPFVAMELVDGQTLRRWLSAEPRSWRRVVAMFDQAGRGLAAAHAVGIVHRDFKPDNVLVGSDGRVRVADFGVARSLELEDAGRPVPAAEESALLTRTGLVLGTPLYMAPEVLAGGPATPESDQFSFCVALYEGLYGERPFVIDPATALSPARRAELAPVPRGRRVPAWLRRIVLRGLAPTPAERWPSMGALLAALGRDPARHLRRGAVLAGVAAITVLAVVRPGATSRPCSEEASLAGIWDAPARAAARAAFGDARVFDSFAAAVDGWTERWQRARTRSCVETLVEKSQTGELMDRRAACLDRQLDDLRAVAQVAGQPSPRLVENAPQLAGGLPDASRCDRRAILDSRVVAPPDPATAAAAGELGVELARAEALDRGGRFEEALALAEALEARAGTLAYPPVEARALEAHGSALINLRRSDEAAVLLARSSRLAGAVGDDRRAASALARQAFASGVLAGKHDEGLLLARDAELLAGRIGDRETLASVAYTLGILRFEKGDLDGAEASFGRARAERVRLAVGPDDYRIAQALNGLAVVAVKRGDIDTAVARQTESLAIQERIQPDDRRTRAQRANLGNLLLHEVRDYGAARALLERALPPGVETTDTTGLAIASLAVARARLGEYGGVVADLERALDILEKRLGPGHHAVASVRVALAEVLEDLEREPEALAQYRAALAIWSKLGVAEAEVHLATLEAARAAAAAGEGVDLAAAGAALSALRHEDRPAGRQVAIGAAFFCQTVLLIHRADLAPASCAQAREAALLGLPADHPERARALWGAAEAGPPAERRALLEQAVAILARRRGDVVLYADVRLSLARTLAADGEREPARELAAAARAALVAALGPGSRRVAAIDRVSREL